MQWRSGPIRYCTKGNQQMIDITLPTSFTNLYVVSLATFGWGSDQVVASSIGDLSVLQIIYLNWQYEPHNIWANFIAIGY